MSEAKFKELLDETYSWPDYYEFKFIVKVAAKDQVLVHLAGFTISEVPSKNGNYISISARKLMQSSQEVLTVYQSMALVEGIISL